MRRQEMTRWFCLCGVFGYFVMATGCGIPKEEHQKTLTELKNVRAEMDADKKAYEESRDALEKKNKTLMDDNSVLKSKLASLGEDMSTMKTKIAQDLSDKEKKIAALMKAQEAARQRAAMYQGLLSKFKQMIDSGKLNVQIRKGRMIVQMSDQILFDPGRDRIKPEGEAALREVSAILASIEGRHFQVAGHTDDVPIRNNRFRSNWELSAARAVNVVKFMSENGVAPERLSAAGFSQFDPVGDNSTAEGRQVNRRIEIMLMPSIEELPQIAEES